MYEHRTAGNGQPEAETTGPTDIAPPIKRFKHSPKLGNRHPGAPISNTQDKHITFTGRTHLHTGSIGGVLHRVTNDVLEGALNQLPPHHHLRLPLPVEKQLTAKRTSLEAGIVGDLCCQIDQIRQFTGCIAPPGIKSSQSEQLPHQVIKANSFPLYSSQRGFKAPGILTHQSDSGLEPGQRGAQFVGNVVQQTALGADQGLHLSRHSVEVLGKIRDLVATPPQQRPHPCIELTVCHRTQGPAKTTNGLGQVPGQQGTEENAGEKPCDNRPPWVWRRRTAPPKGSAKLARRRLKGSARIPSHDRHEKQPCCTRLPTPQSCATPWAVQQGPRTRLRLGGRIDMAPEKLTACRIHREYRRRPFILAHVRQKIP